MTTYAVSPYAGRTFRLWVDFNGLAVTAADVTNATYTVYRVDMGQRTTVAGHNDVAVPTSCFIPTAADTHTGADYNFEHRISAATNKPFPEPGGDYLVVYSFLFVGESDVRVCEVWCHAA